MTRTPSAKATRNMEISEDVDNVTKGFYGMNAPRSHSILTMRNGRDGEVRTHYGLSVPVPPCLHGNPNTNLGSGIFSRGPSYARRPCQQAFQVPPENPNENAFICL